MGLLESQKKELSLSLNSFGNPLELSGKKAWISQIVSLIMLEPGTYPSNPLMGVGLKKYEFEVLDSALSKLRDLVSTQIKTYLPDIPFSDVTMGTREYKGKPILVFLFEFNNSIGLNDTVAVVAEKTGSTIKFDYSM